MAHDDDQDEADREAILARRRRLIALTVAGITTAATMGGDCGDASPGPCLRGDAGGFDAGAMPCLSDAGGELPDSALDAGTDAGTDGGPMPCLAPKPSDAGTDAGTDSGMPMPCLAPKP